MAGWLLDVALAGTLTIPAKIIMQCSVHLHTAFTGLQYTKQNPDIRTLSCWQVCVLLAAIPCEVRPQL